MRSKRIMAVAIIAGIFLLFAGTGFCQDTVSMSEWTQLIEKFGDKGLINWSGGYIEAVGIGAPPERYIGKPNARPMALRAAKVDAYRNLLEVTKGVRVDSQTTVKDFVTESDVINTQIDGIVKGAQVMKQDYMSDGTVEVTVRMPLGGSLSQVIIPKAIEKAPPAPPAPVVAPAAPAPAVVFTGLVVDARGIQARPAMSPKIVDENGKELYGSMQVDREYAIQQGMSGYARDLTAAQSNPRVTANPVTVKGVKSEGPGRCDIVISNADADKIRAAAEDQSFMKKCRVMIVLD
ncbi:MAG: hypothetical protein PHY31_03030 [Smithellaceae bacterium]|nr:hypothetical protein [Smithellaceae bacterium]